jgi:hypothetical protein
VWWARTGEIGKQPNERGVSGKKVVMRIEKKFSRFERILAKVFRAPKELRRPLDQMNSMLWELCDGHRTFDDICTVMNLTFHDEIAPVIHRTELAISQFLQLNLMIIKKEPLNQKWKVGPGLIPDGQQLDELTQPEHYDIELLHGEIP